eukprot:CAMPEP_0204841636 /NCGR_PEP_ID=MMETSP1346-20131115/42983_1 /ASSEMBLY_ACC=CAM_ASM_000771 /TAXON_ID=215587 /ORGANISM="Aplanochytrium stocchinoi, Strain GSBS06" /LENGTH=86 /DNA_ID=CAMNT_0051979927 /DNA_START=375 /DNA_END=632 /DNA_ORIENTATION=+
MVLRLKHMLSIIPTNDDLALVNGDDSLIHAKRRVVTTEEESDLKQAEVKQRRRLDKRSSSSVIHSEQNGSKIRKILFKRVKKGMSK